MRSREEAEDALQSTFLRVHKALAKGVAPEYEAAWLYKIAHNVCLSRHDVIGRRGRLETVQDLDDIEYALAAPEEHHDELVGLSDALAVMPPKLRQALLLREWQGLSYAEIAAAMDTTVSAVETLIFRARRHLAGALETDGRTPVVSRGLSIGALLGRLRALLVGAGPAKVAAGAALIALGGAGLGTAVALNQPDGWRPTPVTSSPQPAAAVSTFAFEQQTVSRRAPIAGVPGIAARPDTSGESTPPSTPAAASPPASPTEAPSAPAQATIAVTPTLPVAPPPVQVTDIPPLAPPVVTAPAVPAVQAPPVALPTVETPTLPALPTVSLPTP